MSTDVFSPVSSESHERNVAIAWPRHTSRRFRPPSSVTSEKGWSCTPPKWSSRTPLLRSGISRRWSPVSKHVLTASRPAPRVQTPACTRRRSPTSRSAFEPTSTAPTCARHSVGHCLVPADPTPKQCARCSSPVRRRAAPAETSAASIRRCTTIAGFARTPVRNARRRVRPSFPRRRRRRDRTQGRTRFARCPSYAAGSCVAIARCLIPRPATRASSSAGCAVPASTPRNRDRRTAAVACIVRR